MIQTPPVADTFYIPSKEELSKVAVGSTVKIIIKGSICTERIWCTVKTIESDNVTAILDNDPVNPEYRYEQSVEFTMGHIINIYE